MLREKPIGPRRVVTKGMTKDDLGINSVLSNTEFIPRLNLMKLGALALRRASRCQTKTTIGLKKGLMGVGNQSEKELNAHQK